MPVIGNETKGGISRIAQDTYSYNYAGGNTNPQNVATGLVVPQGKYLKVTPLSSTNGGANGTTTLKIQSADGVQTAIATAGTTPLLTLLDHAWSGINGVDAQSFIIVAGETLIMDVFGSFAGLIQFTLLVEEYTV